MQPALISFYKVSKCGYLPPRARKIRFGSFQSSFQDYCSWNTGKSLLETKCPESKVGAHKVLPIYSFGVYGSGTNKVAILWNEVETGHGRKMMSVDVQQVIGSARVRSYAAKRGEIPGVASYYWILPAHEYVATVAFDWQVSRPGSFTRYFTSFMATHSPSHVTKRRGSNIIVGYRPSPSESVDTEVEARFAMKRLRYKAEIDKIKNQRSRIQTIVHRRSASWGIESDAGLLASFFESLGCASPRATTDALDFEARIDYRPEEDELSSIIDSYIKRDERASYDVGFRIDGTTHWLSKAVSTHRRELDVTPSADGVIDGDNLYNALRSAQADILSDLNRRLQREAV